MDILLIVGKILPSHYKPVAAAMIEQGMTPYVVHIGDEFASELDFTNAASETLPANITEDEDDAYVQKWMQQKKRAIIKSAFDGSPLIHVKDVVLRADNDEYPSHIYMDWLFKLLPATHAEHRVHIGDNQEVWLEGDYGRLEPLVEA